MGKTGSNESRQARFFWTSILFTLLFSFSSCTSKSIDPVKSSKKVDPSPSSTPSSSNAISLAWLSKTARVLRAGHGLTADDNIAALLKKTKAEAVEFFLKDIRFGDATLDFNLYFLGKKPDQLIEKRDPDTGVLTYDAAVFTLSPAIHSAQQAIRGKDYLSLLKWEQPQFLAPTEEPTASQLTEEEQAEFDSLDRDGKRDFIVQIYFRALDGLISWVENRIQEQTEITREDFCAERARLFERTGPFQLFNGLGYRGNFVFNSYYWTQKIPKYCSYGLTEFDHLTELRSIREKLTRFYEETRRFDPENYAVRSVLDIKAIDPKNYDLEPIRSRLSQSFWLEQANSSTNFNRKRGAFILSRFFCDDLTPIGFQEPSDHIEEGRHASDPSCFACHYKLDPMAGFFKRWGQLGDDYFDLDTLRLDDGVRVSKEEYFENWASNSEEREWEIGYIRSTTDSTLNNYGNHVEDLFAIIERAPEVRSCLVKRMTEYFLGTETNIDAGYLDYLTGKFNEEARENSSRAYKNTVKRIVLSQTFSHPNPDPNVCYDFAPGVNPENQPPCEVAYLLKKNCIDCHNSQNTTAGLNLSRWVSVGEGKMSFPHVDRRGNPIERSESLERIAERLSTADPFEQMPPGRHMPNPEREKLFLWVSGLE